MYGNLYFRQREVSAGKLLDLIGTDARYAYSVTRQLTDSYTGSLIRVRRASDNTELDIGIVSGFLDTSALDTFISGTTGYVVTIYDQSGNGYNLGQSTSSRQSPLASETINGETVYYLQNKTGYYNYLDASNVFDQNNYHEFIVAEKKSTAFSVLSGFADNDANFSAATRDIVPTSSNVRYRENSTYGSTVYPTGGYVQLLGYEMSRSGSTVTPNGATFNTAQTLTTTAPTTVSEPPAISKRIMSSRGNTASNIFGGNFYENFELVDELSSGDQTIVRDNLKSFYM